MIAMTIPATPPLLLFQQIRDAESRLSQRRRDWGPQVTEVGV